MSRSSRVAIAFACVAAALLAGCLSRGADDIQGFVKAPLFGMVYDERNEPCGGARIHVDARAGPSSDLSGRFVIADLARGPHRVAVVKPGYERLEVDVDFYDKSQVLYLKVASLQELLDRAERALAERRLPEAAALVERAAAVDPAHADVRYLRAVHLLGSGRPRDAALILEALVVDGERSPAILLTLADIYQYALLDNDKAKAALAAYLARQEDSGARARLEALK